jgi:hypothetical protein
MKVSTIVIAIAVCAGFLTGCATGSHPRETYEQSQFANRLEYLRFCQRYALDIDRGDW